jgi:3-phosphoshikimate 1-carboxyvinyltransferase
MGADIKLLNQRTVCGEDIADIEICAKPLHGVQIDAADVVRAIDEIPILAVACSVATGKSQITGAAELRVKESDRLTKVRELLESFSIQVEEQADGLTIAGQSSTEFRYIGSNKESWRKSGDHRISMCGAICDYLSSGKFQIADAKAVETSFPTFAQCFKQLS